MSCQMLFSLMSIGIGAVVNHKVSLRRKKNAMKLSPFRFLLLACLAGTLAAPIVPLALRRLDQRIYARPGFAATAFEWQTAAPESQGVSKVKLDALRDILAARKTK